MTNTPAYLKDAKDLLTENGFATSNVWYHGTSSELVESITQHGLKRSGDKALQEAAKKAMKTIGHEYEASVDPIFLTQSKEIAYYWAQQKVRERKVRLQGDDEPVVLAINLPQELSAQVKPDVGAASLLMLKEGEAFMAYLAAIYEEQGQGIPEIDLMKARREEYLNTLGMAYFDNDIESQHLQAVTA